MNGINFHSRMYCNMIKNFIEIINKGGVPNLNTALTKHKNIIFN